MDEMVLGPLEDWAADAGGVSAHDLAALVKVVEEAVEQIDLDEQVRRREAEEVARRRGCSCTECSFSGGQGCGCPTYAEIRAERDALLQQLLACSNEVNGKRPRKVRGGAHQAVRDLRQEHAALRNAARWALARIAPFTLRRQVGQAITLTPSQQQEIADALAGLRDAVETGHG